MSAVAQDLHQFSNYLPPINLSFHQYLLKTEEPLLVHTGNVQHAKIMLPQLKALLNGKALKYIFVSHFEADECGGVSVILDQHPEAVILCSGVTARQLSGFGFPHEAMVAKPGEKLVSTGFELEFFSYPSEMHLWEGLLLMENQRQIFFSSDLMMRPGEAAGTVLESDWQTEIDNIRMEQVPDPEKRLQLQKALARLQPKFVATGHGPCLQV